MRRPLLAATLMLAGPAAAADAPPEPPDAELLEFLGETTDVDDELLGFLESGAAERALDEAEKEKPKEDDDE